MRIFFIGEGRLGNQIFQYTALSAIAPAGSPLIAIGLEDLEELFELRGPALTVLRGGIWLKRFAKYVLAPFILRPLARYLRLISYAREPESGDTHRGAAGEFELRRGLFAGLVFVDGGYYQSSEFWRDVFPPRALEMRQSWRTRAREALVRHAGRNPARPYFLHVRRGDYLGFTTYGVTDLLLPTEFFRQAIEKFRAHGGFDLLVIVTDDARWAERRIRRSRQCRGDFRGSAHRLRRHGRMRGRHRFEQHLFARGRALHAQPRAGDRARILVWLPRQTLVARENPLRSSAHRVSRGSIAGRRMIRATAISVIDQGLLSAVNFLLALVLIRYATAEEYGLYTQLIGLQSLFSVLHAGLFVSAFLSMLPRLQGPARSEYRAGMARAELLVTFLSMLVVAAGTWLVAAWLGHPITLLLSAAAAVALLSLWWREFVRAGHFAAFEPLRVLRVDAAFATLAVGGIAFLVATNQVTAANVLWSIGIAGAAVTVLPIYRKARESRVDKNALRANLASSWQSARWEVLTSLVSWSHAQTFVFFAAAQGGLRAAAQISAARLLTMPLALVWISYANILRPNASRLLVGPDARHEVALLARRSALLVVVMAGGYASPAGNFPAGARLVAVRRKILGDCGAHLVVARVLLVERHDHGRLERPAQRARIQGDIRHPGGVCRHCRRGVVRRARARHSGGIHRGVDRRRTTARGPAVAPPAQPAARFRCRGDHAAGGTRELT